MIDARLLSAAVLAAVVSILAPSPLLGSSRQHPVSSAPDVRDQIAQRDFAQRVQAYVELHRSMALNLPPLRVSSDPAEIRQAMDALVIAIQTARRGARQGDMFSPEIARVFRRAVAEGCHEQFLELLAAVNEEADSQLSAPSIHARWPDGAPLPTMWPGVLAALPRLPRELEYRFLNRDLVLHDIDANLIVDFVPDAIPILTSSAR